MAGNRPFGAGEPQETIEYQNIVFGTHFEKIEKIVIFAQKMHVKNFQSRFSPADLARTTNRYRSKIHPIGPQTPVLWALLPASYHILPHVEFTW